MGIIGIWRVLNLDYDSPDEHIMKEISDEYQFFPEGHDFIISEISKGTTKYLADQGTSIPRHAIKYHLQGIDPCP